MSTSGAWLVKEGYILHEFREQWRLPDCPLSVEPPAGIWSLVSEHLSGPGRRPTPEETAAAVRALLHAASVPRCRRNDEVIRILQQS